MVMYNPKAPGCCRKRAYGHPVALTGLLVLLATGLALASWFIR